jgi:hypothetical protein
MMSIGGFSFISHWEKALKANPTQLGINATANAAKQFNVGMEIDYEKSSNRQYCRPAKIRERLSLGCSI